jgi:hypothetical protein
MKTCRRCKELKFLKDFNKDKRAKDGKTSYCKLCVNAQVGAYRQTKTGRSYSKAYRQSVAGKTSQKTYNQSQKGKIVRNRSQAKYKELNPEKIKAHFTANNAIRTGEILKPTSCSNCDNPKGRIEAHHTDYTKPLDVIWLCRRCHISEHKVINEFKDTPE